MLRVEHPNRSAASEGATRASVSENHLMFAEDSSVMELGADGNFQGLKNMAEAPAPLLIPSSRTARRRR